MPSTLDPAPYQAPSFAWTHVGSTGPPVLRLTGELDLVSAPNLARALSEALAAERVVVLDLRGLAFMDVAGLHTALDAGRHAVEHGRRLLVIRGPRPVDAVFVLTGADASVDWLTGSDPPPA